MFPVFVFVSSLLVQVVEGVRYLDDDLHACLHGELLDGSISLLPKRLGVVLKGQPRDLPLLKDRERNTKMSSRRL